MHRCGRVMRYCKGGSDEEGGVIVRVAWPIYLMIMELPVGIGWVGQD